MARVKRKTSQGIQDLADAINDLKAYTVAQLRLAQADIATIAADTDVGVTPTFVALGFHNDRYESPIASANASTLGTSITLVNEIRAVYEAHRVDTLAHPVADATNTIAAPIASDLATAMTLANELKADYNAHRTQATVHATNDSTNTISSANASDQGTLNTLANELKLDINAHMASGPVAKHIRVVGA